MKILIIPSWYISSYNKLSGMFVKFQSTALAKSGNQVGLIAINEISIKEIWKHKKVNISHKVFKDNGVNVISVEYPSIPKLHKLRNQIKTIIFKKLFKEYIGTHGLPDIVHIHSFMVGELAIWIKENYNIPYVITEHYSGFSRGLVSQKDLIRAKNTFKNSSCNVAVSNKFAAFLNKQFNEDFQYIPNIVNTEIFKLKEKKQKEEFVFINIASLDKNKNQDMLIRSFSKSFKDISNVRLLIVGGGPELDSYQELIKKLNMSKQIELYGWATQNEVVELLQNSDVFVLSSKYETFGTVTIEALASGIPVVSTKCGGSESIIINDKLGLLCDINENDLSGKLKKIFSDIGNYDREYLHNYTNDNFSESAVALKLNNLFLKILKR